MERRDRNTGGLVILTAVLALFIGGVIGWMAEDTFTNTANDQASSGMVPGIGGGPDNEIQNNQSQPSFSSNVSNFRVNMNSLLKEHAVLASDYLINLYDGKNVSALKSGLDTNSIKIADTFGSIYQDEARSQFLQMWERHIELYSDYTQALKNNRENDANQARQELENMAERMGEMMVSFDSNFSQQQIADLMQEHVRLTLAIVEAHSEGDSQSVVNNKTAGFMQAGRFADYIGQVIASSRQDQLPQ